MKVRPATGRSAQIQCKTERRSNVAHLFGWKSRNSGPQPPLWNRLDMIAIDRAIPRQTVIN